MTDIRGYIADQGLAEQMFKLAVEACPSGMVMIDGDGIMVMVNTEIENQFGYTREELLGQPVDMLVPERMRAQHARHRHQFTPKPEARRMGVGRDLFGLRKDGTEFPVEVGLNPVHAGEHLLVLGVIVDISQRKHIERMKEEFVATVSHELRTPLTSIAGSLGLLAGQWSGKLPESAARLLTIAHKNSQRLVRLINDILDIEKIESGRVVFNFSKVALRDTARQAIEDNRGFASGFGVDVRLDTASVAADVYADPDRLVQVITNLLSNAIKFSPPGAEVLVAVEKNGDAFRISVRDHGAGIPEEFKSRIFEKFAQADGTDSRQKGGTGLGLSIVKQIVERLSGTIGFHEAPAGGTVFYVDLPPWDGTAGGEIDVAAEGSAPRILLCDDDAAIAKVVRMRLRRAGFTVDFAHTVDTAIARTGTNRYAAIMVDLRLRDNDGIDLIARIRAQPHHSETPVLVISGDTERGRGDVRSPALHILDWVNKPIDFKRLTEILLAATSAKPRGRPRILHVDDDRHILAAVAQELRAMADVISVDSAEGALRTLATDRVDLVVLDIELGQDSGLNLLPDIHDRSGNAIPVIIFSCHGDRIKCGDQAGLALSKMNSSLETLGEAVRDRLALMPAQLEKEVA
jgi:PAS domain S-box-containing protein